MPFPDWMPQYDLCFPIVSEHFGPARIRLTPTGYEKDVDGDLAPDHRDRVYGLYVTARFEDDSREFKYDISDFVMPEHFEALATVLDDSANKESEAKLQGDDGFIDIAFHRKPDEPIRIVCNSPSPGWRVTCLRLQLEAFAKPDALTDTRKQLDHLIELVGQINSGTREA